MRPKKPVFAVDRRAVAALNPGSTATRGNIHHPFVEGDPAWRGVAPSWAELVDGRSSERVVADLQTTQGDVYNLTTTHSRWTTWWRLF